MSHQLTAELIDQIVFGMENQTTSFFLDLERMTVVPEARLGEAAAAGPAAAGTSGTSGTSGATSSPAATSASGAKGAAKSTCPATAKATGATAGRFIHLPTWGSADGFQLMERFAVSLRNPLVHQELLKILSSGKGVFRQFKDCLKQYPGVEKLWLSYKKNEMRGVVLTWMAGLEEEMGIEFDYPEFEDTGDLIRSDFRFAFGVYDDFASDRSASLEALILDAWGEMAAAAGQSDAIPALTETTLRGLREGTIVAGVLFNVEGEAVAIIAAALVGALPLVRPAGLEVNLLYTRPECRGLGAAAFLLEQLPVLSRERGLGAVSITIPAPASFLRRVVERMGYSQNAQVFCT